MALASQAMFEEMQRVVSAAEAKGIQVRAIGGPGQRREPFQPEEEIEIGGHGNQYSFCPSAHHLPV